MGRGSLREWAVPWGGARPAVSRAEGPGRLAGTNHEDTFRQAKEGSWRAREGCEHQRGTASCSILDSPVAAQLRFRIRREDVGRSPGRQFDRFLGRHKRMRA